jgi:hypothetical protein
MKMSQFSEWVQKRPFKAASRVVFPSPVFISHELRKHSAARSCSYPLDQRPLLEGGKNFPKLLISLLGRLVEQDF